MGFEGIENSEIAVRKPITAELMRKIKSSFDWLYSQVSAFAGPSPNLANPSFELDTDSDGIPDGWTRSLYTGGAGVYDVDDAIDGIKSYKFTHPGGVGNGGGYLESDYFGCNPLNPPWLSCMIRCSGTGVRNILQARYFTRNKTPISDQNVVNDTTNPSIWSRYRGVCVVPNTARYMKIRAIGGYTDTNPGSSRSIWFDRISAQDWPDALLTVSTGGNMSVDWRQSASWYFSNWSGAMVTVSFTNPFGDEPRLSLIVYLSNGCTVTLPTGIRGLTSSERSQLHSAGSVLYVELAFIGGYYYVINYRTSTAS